jgi:hypothetical protein
LAVEAVDVLIEHEGMVGMPSDGQALLVAEAGLLDVNINIAHRAHDSHCLVLRPAGIGIGYQAIARVE